MNLLLIASPCLHPFFARLLSETDCAMTLQAPSARLCDQIKNAHGYDAIVLADGAEMIPLAGLCAYNIPLILPRVHNAAALLLGGADAYRALHDRFDGAICFVPAGSKTPLCVTPRADCACLCYLADTALCLPDTALAAATDAHESGWDFFNAECDYTLLRRLLAGDWSDDAFVRVAPRAGVTHSYDRDLMA